MGSLLLAVAACGGGSDASDGALGADATPRADGAGPGAALDELLVHPAADVAITTRQDATSGEIYQTTISAAFRATAIPSPYGEVDRAGVCVRMTAEPAFCDPPCEGDMVCTATDTCTAIAPTQSAGTLTVGAQTLEPTAGTYFSDTSGGVFAATDTVTISAAGDTFAAFTGSIAVPDPITDATLPDALRAGQDATFTWTPAADTGSYVGVILLADRGHGPVQPSRIYCAVDDSVGEIVVPSSLIDPHIDPSNWSCGDCFPSQLVRFRTAATSGGDVRLWYGQGVDVYATPDRSP